MYLFNLVYKHFLDGLIKNLTFTANKLHKIGIMK